MKYVWYILQGVWMQDAGVCGVRFTGMVCWPHRTMCKAHEARNVHATVRKAHDTLHAVNVLTNEGASCAVHLSPAGTK